MVSAAGFLFSALLGASARRLQVQLVGKSYPRSLDRVPGYILSSGVFVGAYYVLDQYAEGNKQLLARRLLVLREQRAKKDAFYEFEYEPDHRLIPEKRGRFFTLLDKFGASYK